MTFRILEAVDASCIEAARTLFQEYAGGLGFDLDFQDFQTELDTLPGAYAPPGGCLLLALPADPKFEAGEAPSGPQVAGVRHFGTAPPAWAGCVALRPLEPGICELKRMYVRSAFRGHGLGRLLAEAIVERAAELGYATMRLDTIGERMIPAVTLYRSLGFERISAYCPNPIPGAEFYELRL